MCIRDSLPGATNVYDVNSKGLTELALRFNQGINTDGDALKKRTHFNIAGAFNPNVRKLSLIHISEPTRLRCISYAVFCLKK
ncbi:hypothetical protein JMUB7523_26400 [Staphylococcus aureus]